MNATALYVQTCRYVISSNAHEPDSWADLYKHLPILRQALSCCVCQKILHTPMGPTESACQHHVCRECIGGKMKLKPQCSWCKDYNAFVENSQLRIIVQCYRKLCEYLASSSVAVQLASTCNGNTQSNGLLSIIHEGMTVRDVEQQDHKTENPAPPTLQKINCANKAVASNPSPEPSKTQALSITIPTVTSTELSSPETKDPSNLTNGHLTSPESVEVVSSSISPNPVDSSDGIKPKPMIHRRVSARRNRYGRRRVPKRPYTPSPQDNAPSTTTQNEELNDQTCADKESPVTKDIPILKITETVAIEHDYNKGLLGPAPDLVAEERSELPRPVIHDRTMVAKPPKLKKAKPKTGCRCGLATAKPGNLTCCGQRCPCYSSFKGCVGCKCRGCRNPRGDPARNPLTLQLQQMHKLPFPLVNIRASVSEDSDIEIDI